jgi:hypothetical protein
VSYLHSIETDPDEELAQLHYFSIKKGEVEFVIAVKEYAQRNRQHMRFFAQSDKPVNQKTAPFLPFGWGETLSGAISECLKIIRKYPYEPA